MTKLQRTYPDASVELWSQDEARLGLMPILRGVWSPRGQRPVVTIRRRYEWVYLYGFVRPETGEVEWLILPTVSIEVFQIALEEFARAVGAGEKKHILLVVDQAGWHKSEKLRVPNGIHLHFLPPYSPELQPSEHLWPLVHEGVANDLIETIEEHERRLMDRCNVLASDPATLSSSTLFHWWPHAGQQSVNPN